MMSATPIFISWRWSGRDAVPMTNEILRQTDVSAHQAAGVKRERITPLGSPLLYKRLILEGYRTSPPHDKRGG
jgi:hypothetical protein